MALQGDLMFPEKEHILLVLETLAWACIIAGMLVGLVFIAQCFGFHPTI